MKRFLFLIFIIFASSISYSQLGEKIYYKSPIYVEAGSGYQKYSIGDTSLSLLYFPVSVTLPISSELSVSISNNPYMITRKLAASEVDVSSLSDTKISARYVFLNRKALLNVFANIPTGKTKLELSEFDIFTDLGLSILKYRVTSLGEGFNIGAGLNYAFQISKKSTVGIGVSYNNRAEYQPINWERIQKDEVFKYNAPDELGFNLSYFSSITDKFRISLDLFYTTYSYAQINSIDIYEPGGLISLIAALSFSTGEINHLLLLNPRFYGENKQKRLNNWISFKSSFQLDAEYKISFNLFNEIIMTGLLQARNYGEYQDNWHGRIYTMHESRLYSAGLGLNIPLYDLLSLNALAKYNTGNVTMTQDMDFNGFEASFRINYAF